LIIAIYATWPEKRSREAGDINIRETGDEAGNNQTN
jgi:hypothetical protein